MNAAGSRNYALVGGGMLGLTLALRLAQAGQTVTVYEAAQEIGGLASAWQLGDIVWDKHYHVTLLSDSALRKLLTELGLERDMQWVETRTGFFTDGKLVSMSNTIEFLTFPPLNLLDKFRLGASIFYASRVRDWKRLERIPVADWLRKLSGARTFAKIWLPLLRAKLGENYKLASAAFIWATIQRMYAARKTGLKKEMFGYVPGGYARVLERFAAVLAEQGVEIKLGHKLDRIEHCQGHAVLTFSNGSTSVADDVVLTVPGSVAAQALPQLPDQERSRLTGLRYQGIVCASLLLTQPLSSFYVTNITDEAPFTAVIEMSALVDRNKQFGGRSLIYLPKYVASDDPVFALSDEELRVRFVTALERMYPRFRRDHVLEFKVSRVRQVFPIPTLRYSETVPPQATSIPGVFVINSAHILNGTLNVNETVQLAEAGVRMLLDQARRDTRPIEGLLTARSQPAYAAGAAWEQ